MSGIYIHIPFCRQACHYCDFHFSTSLKNKDAMLHAILQEIELRKEYLNQNTSINTIYFGGGTPSLLSADEINLIIDHIAKHFQIDADTEITLETNPDNLDRYFLQSLKQTAVNRLSIGIQSFYEEDLKLMNRAHTAEMALRCVPDAADVGFSQITIDLIYALPNLSHERWVHNLAIAFALPINHLSCYCLTIESKTALADMVKKKKVKILDEAHAAEQFKLLVELSEKAGFEQYEISNFCRDKKYSKHNSNYWRGESYLGIGPSAHSYNGVSRQWNVSNNSAFIQKINENLVPSTIEILTPDQQYNEYILTSLRTCWGVEVSKLNKLGDRYTNYFHDHISQKLKEETVQERDSVYTLTQQGKLFADRIAADLFI